MGAVAVPLIASVVGAVTGAVLGGLLVYSLSGRRAQKEWRAEKRAEVVSDLYRLLSDVENTAGLATRPDADLETRRRRILENQEALREFLFYFGGHALWIDADWIPALQPFINGLSSALGPYEAELKKGTPDSLIATKAAEHVQRIVPQAQQVLGAQFRAIAYPKPWREHLADGLEWFDTRNRTSVGTDPSSPDRRRKA